ncbi:MAG: polyprenyl synthetase family protein [Candidatus Nanopelagicales bacterium]|nr:polyprenyl synthetase family protein [Candidatus Nanopelagicales bacterium]MCF8551609.1 polyprenyl synthetase family protein [Candidatus Nanopelagicales bacterium]
MIGVFESVDPALETRISRGLDQVEAQLLTSVQSEYPFVTETSRHLVVAGGKRFRPILTLLAAEFGDPDSPGVVPAAVVVELTHLATLYHDDVMDEATLRRGAQSANSRWDNTVAILTGDFLFARASQILADLGPDAVRIQAETFERLCTGQINETVGPLDGQDPVKHHLAVLADKTGSLIATSGRFGAMLAGADLDTVNTLTAFGERIGVAFQLADDIVDITSISDQSGKTPGTDLREGIPTLAALIALSQSNSDSARLRDLLARPLTDDAEHREALELLREHDSLSEARLEARRWADESRRALDPLPDIPAKAALSALCDYVVTRTG